MANNLGRGISAFLQEQYDGEDKQSQKVVYLDISDIEANQFQPRKSFDNDSIISLAASIKEKGIIQPITVRKSIDNNGYELVAGERRLRASKLAGLSQIPAIISNISDKESFELAILENIQREDLNPIDEAEAYKKLIEEFAYTQDGVAKVTGKSRSYIANMLRLLSSDKSVQDALIKNLISIGHAKSIIASSNQTEILNEVISKGLTVRETEKLVNSKKCSSSEIINFESEADLSAVHNENNHTHNTQISSKNIEINDLKQTDRTFIPIDNGENLSKPVESMDLDSISNKMSEVLRTKVSIKVTNNRGAMLIYFDNLDELDRLLKEITRSGV